MVKPPPEGPFVEKGNSRRASALALTAGADMACHVYNRLFSKDVEEEVLDEATRRVLRARVRCDAAPGLPGACNQTHMQSGGLHWLLCRRAQVDGCAARELQASAPLHAPPPAGRAT